jgi:cell division protein FtsZ
MTISISVPHDDLPDLAPRISVIGVGGAGGNAVNNMIRSNLEGVEFVATNTDAQALKQSLAEMKIQLGVKLTQGLGAGARPEVGRDAADEAIEEIMEHLGASNMVFITAGMGGGTGSGAAPVIAQACREHGILTVGVVTKPFHFEGLHRMRIAEAAIEELTQYVDTLIIIPNQNLFRIANEKTTFADAFNMADEVLHSGVRGVTDLMVMPGLINLDFADIRTVMSEMGKAMMGTGEATGEKRALDAAEAAINNPLLEDMSMKGAKGVLINITGGLDMTLFEVDEAANRIRDEVDSDANIIFGSTFDEKLQGTMRVSVVATGIAAEGMSLRPRTPLAVVTARAKNADKTAEKAIERQAEELGPLVAEALSEQIIGATEAATTQTAAPAAPAARPAAAAPSGNVLLVGEDDLDDAAMQARVAPSTSAEPHPAITEPAAAPAREAFLAPAAILPPRSSSRRIRSMPPPWPTPRRHRRKSRPSASSACSSRSPASASARPPSSLRNRPPRPLSPPHGSSRSSRSSARSPARTGSCRRARTTRCSTSRLSCAVRRIEQVGKLRVISKI